MRTAVVRIRVDPDGVLTAAQLRDGMAALRVLADDVGVGLVDRDLSGMPAARREVELLMAGADSEQLKLRAIQLCANAFGTVPVPGVLTYISRGTDDDAHGVLAGF